MIRRRATTIGVVTAAAIVGFSYRYLGLRGFPDDHFIHLTRAQQLLFGEWPVHDFADAGAPLTSALSSAAMALAAPNDALWAEALLTCGAFAAAAALIALAVLRLGGHPAWATWAAAMTIVSRPRTYSHPKLWIYPAAVLAACWYVRAPSLGRRAMLAGLTVIAFLLRHDHGIYVAAGLFAMLFVVHRVEGWRVAARRVAEYAALGLLCVSPYLVYVGVSRDGLTGYMQSSLEVNREEASRRRMDWPRFQPALRSLVGLPASAPTVTVNVRWAEAVTVEERTAIERSFDLRPLRPLGAFIYQYELPNATVERQWALVSHPAVADTGGIDRSVRPGWRGLASRGNAATLLYYVHYLVSLLAIVIGWRRAHTDRVGGGGLLTVGVLGITAFTFLRDPLMDRMADTFGTWPIAAAVMLSGRGDRGANTLRYARKVIAVACGGFLLAATALVGEARDEVAWARLDQGPRAVTVRAREVTSQLRTWPWRRQWPTGDDAWPVVRYAHACTRPSDPLLVTWHAPHLYVIAQRRFAGTETVLMPALRDPARVEPRLVRRIVSDVPPIVLVSMDGWEEFRSGYPMLADFLTRAYAEVGVHTGRERPHISVRVLRARTRESIDAETGWPCFAAP